MTPLLITRRSIADTRGSIDQAQLGAGVGEHTGIKRIGLIWVFFSLVWAGSVSVAKAALYYDRVCALCVGINQYASTNFSALALAEADAAEVSNVFSNRFGYEVKTLLGSNATRANVMENLEQYHRNLRSNDVLIIYWSGHGETVPPTTNVIAETGVRRRGYLITADTPLISNTSTNEQLWATNALEMAELGRITAQMKARHVLLIADACYSGYLGFQMPVERSGKSPLRLDQRDLLKLPSRIALTSGTAGQTAREKPDSKQKHAFFTEALLTTLQSDIPQCVREVHIGIRREISNWSGLMSMQNPQLMPMFIENSGEFVFIPKDCPTASVPGYLERIVGFVLNRGTDQTTLEDFYLAAEATDDYRFAVDSTKRRDDWAQRFKRLQENASVSQVYAAAALYFCYAKGLGTVVDPVKAGYWARRAFDLNDEAPESRYTFALALLNGHGLEKNELSAEQMLKQLVQEGHILSSVFQILRLPRRMNMSQWQRVETVLEMGAKSNLFTATLALARLRMGGHPVASYKSKGPSEFMKPEEAVRLLKPLVDQKIPEAEYLMSACYRVGKSGFPPRDGVLALDLMRRAARSGYVEAQVELGDAYHFGDRLLNLEPDGAEALKWATLASDHGSSEAKYLLALIYEGKSGAPVNLIKSRKYIEEAVELNNADAIWRAGYYYYTGTAGFAKNTNTAEAYFQQAAATSPFYALRMAKTEYIPKKLKHLRFAAIDQDYPPAQDELLLLLADVASEKSVLEGIGRTDRDFTFALREIDKFQKENKLWLDQEATNAAGWLERGDRCSALSPFDLPPGIFFRDHGVYRLQLPAYQDLYCFKKASALGHPVGAERVKSYPKWLVRRSEEYTKTGRTKEAAWALAYACKLLSSNVEEFSRLLPQLETRLNSGVWSEVDLRTLLHWRSWRHSGDAKWDDDFLVEDIQNIRADVSRTVSKLEQINHPIPEAPMTSEELDQATTTLLEITVIKSVLPNDTNLFSLATRVKKVLGKANISL